MKEQKRGVEKAEKDQKAEKTEKTEKAEKDQKAEKTEKTEKAEKDQKAEKPEKAEKAEKDQKTEKPEKAEKAEKDQKTEKPDEAENAESKEQPERAAKEDGKETATKKQKDSDTEKSEAQSGRRMNLGINTVVFAALIVVGLVFANVISSRIYGRADLTEDGLYSLSDASEKLVKKLPRDLKVKLFVSKDLIPGYTSTSQYIKDLLDEYKNASNGRFKWEVIHPEADEKFKKEAERYGIKPFVARAQTSTALEAKTLTFGMVIQYNKPDSGESVEVLPRLFPGIERNIEYLITERIKRLTVKRKKIQFVSGHGEFPVQAQDKVKGFLQQMFSQYEVEIGPATKPIGDDVDILVLMTPQKPFTQEEVKNIDQFLMKGEKGALFLIDGMVRRQPQQRMPNQQTPNIFMAAETGLEDLLDKWGVKINADIIMDQQLQLFPTQRGMIFHPGIPAVRVPGLKNTITPFLISSLEINRAYLGDKGEGKPFQILPIMASSSKAWAQQPPFIFDIAKKPKPPSGEKTKAYVLGALIEGLLPSAVAEKEDKSLLSEAASKVRVAVIGDADILWLSRQMQGNSIFLQNIMDRLAQDETLIKLRNKTAQDRALTLPESRTKVLAVKAANMLGLPILVVLMGIILSMWRRVRRRRANI